MCDCVCVYVCAFVCIHVYLCMSICVCMHTCALMSDSNVKIQDNLEKNMFMSPDIRDALMLPYLNGVLLA